LTGRWEDNITMDLMVAKAGVWIEIPQDLVQCQTLFLAIFEEL
jgi:hypothetical protein